MRKMCPENILKFFTEVGFGSANGVGLDKNAVVGSFIVVGKLGSIAGFED